MTDQPHLGFLCSPDHSVFAGVAASLRERGLSVSFYDPDAPLSTETVRGLDAVVNKKTRPASYVTLRRAAALGVPTWNDFVVYCVCGFRLVGLHALDAVGYRTPPVSFDPPADGDYVAKQARSWDGVPIRNGEGDFYQPLLRTDARDLKYYGVFDGERVHVRVLEVTSKLDGEKRVLGRREPDPALAANFRDLFDKTGAFALGVDVVIADGDPYAVDVNAAPSFRGTGLDAAITDSIASLLP
ncbi:hypothetical protein [Haloarchaeobius sp. DFWS5]|uniref:hypothetical protein n=1 Tax=Haloarchaeobius sp. DFWS5 TaxID=3446114 RepID=UPI003EBA3D38